MPDLFQVSSKEELWLMLKYDDVISILNNILKITNDINLLLNTEVDDVKLSTIETYYNQRMEYISSINDFFGNLKSYDMPESEKTKIISITDSINKTDKTNVEIIYSKLSETKKSLEIFQKQKSVLLYAKS